MAAVKFWVFLIGLSLSSVIQAEECRTICDSQDGDLTEYINLALYRGFRWLHRQEMAMAEDLGDRFNVQDMQGLLTLQLLHPEFYAELPFEKRLLIRTLQEHAMMATLAFARQSGDRAGSVSYVDPIQFSYQLLSMEATCIDTRQFFDLNLQYHLTRVTKEFPEPNYGSPLQFAFSLLPICSSGSPLYPKAWLKLLSVKDENQPCAVVDRNDFVGQHEKFVAHTVSTLSALVMTLKCAGGQVPEVHREVYHKRLFQFSKCIADWQNTTVYGFGGNLRTTALAVQALVATGFDQTKWHCRGAVHHLLQSQQLDGSFGYGTIDETSAVLLALAGKHIGALAYADIECPDGRRTHALPQPITALDSKRTFELITFNDYDGSYSKNNVSFVMGENLLQALIRAKLDPYIEFSFTAEEFELFGEEGIFLTSVNEVSNSRRTYFHWLVVRLNSDGEEVQGGLISLEDLEPKQGDVIKLAYVDITPYDRRPAQLPRPIEKDDMSFDVRINIKNNLTGEEESFQTRVLTGENIHQAFWRAWKDPEVDFTFGAAPFIIFNKPGVYLTAVNGVDIFPSRSLYWLVHVLNRDGRPGGMGGLPGDNMNAPAGGMMAAPPGGMMGGPPGGMMGGNNASMIGEPPGGMMERPPDGMMGGPPDGMMGEPGGLPTLSPQPTSLEEERLRPGDVIELVYVDLTPFSRYLNPNGNGGRELPKDIEETDETITFTLTVINAVKDIKWEYNVTLIEGEDLHDSFLRLWKDPDVYFIYGATRFDFFGRYGLYVTGINQLYNNRQESYQWIIKPDFLIERGVFIPFGLTDVVPEDGENIVVAYVDLAMLRDKIEGRTDRGDDEDDGDGDNEREGDEERSEEEDLSVHDIAYDIRDCDTTANVTIIIFNTYSLQFDRFIVTIIEGETMLNTLLRAYKSPDINFRFSVDTGVFLFRYDVYLTSVNGVVNNKTIGRRWLISTDISDDVNAADTRGLLSITPRDGSTYTLRYTDLTQETLIDIGDELPTEIEEGGESVTFTLIVVNERNGQFSKYNVTSSPGETLVHALKRAWKDEETDFNFAAYPFEFFGKTGVYLLAVNGVANGRGDYFHWVVKTEKNESKDTKEDLADYLPLSLTEVVPEEGSVIKLVFFDLSEIIEAKRARYQFVGLPRRIFDDDQLITFTVYVANNITGEHSKYEIDSIVGENLADILTRAWKDPNIDFSFSASPFVLFSKLGFYPVSVQGVENDPQNNRYWLIKYAPLCPEDAEEDAGDDSGYGPVDLLEFKAYRGYAAKLVYLDLSKYAEELNPSGSRGNELPPDIKEGDATTKFTLVVFNKLSQRKWTYNVTILEGESLLDGFLRLWKDDNTSFHFGAVAHRFAGRFGVYITSLNGVYSSFRDLTLWLIPPAEQIEREENMEDGREGVEEMFNFSFYGLTEVFPKNEDTIHVVYVDLSRHRREIAQLSGEGDGGDEEREVDVDEERQYLRIHDLPKKILGCHSKVNVMVHVVNNITQESDGFNVTIIEGENLLTALKRAWQSPDIDFNFATGTFIFLNKFGIFPTSVNGVMNDRDASSFWLVKTKNEYGEVEGGTKMLLDLTEVKPEDGYTVILLYADLSYLRDQFDLIHKELPADIEEGQATATFTLVVNIGQDYKKYNITILEGETLAEGLFRAWKDEGTMFNFLGDYMEQFGKNGFYPVAVNHVVKKPKEKIWLVVDSEFDPCNCNRYLPEEYEPISLDEYRPKDGEYVKLVYVCVEEFFYQEPGYDEFPGLIREKDESFVLTLYVVNEITGEKTQYNITMLKGENLIDALLRAWKDPEIDLNFSGSVFGLFNTLGYYLTSVNGIENDHENFYFWVAVDPTEEKARDCSEIGRLTRPIGLERYKPLPGYPAVLAYRNFSDFRLAGEVIGNSPKELPRDIADDDNTITFKLFLVNTITHMKQYYNITIIEGETLLAAFFRAYKDPEIKLNFNAGLVDFFGNFGVYFQSINGVTNDFDNLYFWCIKDVEDEDPIANPFSVAKYVPEDGEDVHVAFVDFSPYRQDIEALLRFLRNRRRGRIVGYNEEEEEGGHGGEGGDYEGYLPFEIDDYYPSINISIIIANNLTQEYTMHNLTILHGETLVDAFLRLWRDPDVSFNFAAKPFTFFGKTGLYPVSINGLANDHDALTLWSIHRYSEPESEVPIGLLRTKPRQGEVFAVVYADLSAYRDILVARELPRGITEDDSTVDFTVHVVNNVTGRFCAFNLSVVAGENLFVGLIRAWKDPNIDFNFHAKAFEFFGTYGIFLVSVKDVAIDHEKYYAWLAHPKPRNEDIDGAMNPAMGRIWGLTDLIPMDGFDYVLVYKDVSGLFEGMGGMDGMEGMMGENWQ